MDLGELIQQLEQADQDHIVPIGFHKPHSYHEWHWDVAFEPVENISVRDMLAAARSALGIMKSDNDDWPGDYEVTIYSKVWIQPRLDDHGAERLTELLVNYMLGTPQMSRSWKDHYEFMAKIAFPGYEKEAS